MKMRRSNNKGFTIVELVIVIAVIAILAAVLIPTIAGLVRAANVSSDTQLVKNLNTALAAKSDVDSISEALAAAEEFGYDVAKINASAIDNEILYDAKNNVFCYFNADNNGEITYIGTAELTAEASDYWVIDDEVNDTYATYLYKYEGNTVDTTLGLDVTACANVTKVVFTGAETAYIYTAGGELEIEAPYATVHHYGYADSVNIIEVALNSYHVYGTVAKIEVQEGRVEFAPKANVGVLVVTGDKDVIIDADSSANVSNVIVEEGRDDFTEISNKVAAVIANPENVKQVAKAEIAGQLEGITKFISGSGSAADPYIIGNADHMQNISEFGNDYTYFKVADGVKVIDCAGWTSVVINGCFDGNGAAFVNVDNYMFDAADEATEVELKNFSVVANIVKNAHCAAVMNYAAPTTSFKNVDVSGYIQGSYAAASYVRMGGTYGTTTDTTYYFENCESTATLVATSGGAAGFIAHPYWGTGANKIYIKDSAFTGTMSVTAGCTYIAVNAAGKASVYMQYSAGYNVDSLFQNSGSYKLSETANADGWYVYGAENTQGTYCYANYVNSEKTSKLKSVTGTNPEKGGIFSASVADGAVKATAVFSVGPDGNGTTVTGPNFTGAYIAEELAPIGGAFSTNDIKYFDITVNGNATEETGVSGNVFNIVNSKFGTTYTSATVTIIQYNAQGVVVAITTWDIAK